MQHIESECMLPHCSIAPSSNHTWHRLESGAHTPLHRTPPELQPLLSLPPEYLMNIHNVAPIWPRIINEINTFFNCLRCEQLMTQVLLPSSWCYICHHLGPWSVPNGYTMIGTPLYRASWIPFIPPGHAVLPWWLPCAARFSAVVLKLQSSPIEVIFTNTFFVFSLRLCRFLNCWNWLTFEPFMQWCCCWNQLISL